MKKNYLHSPEQYPAFAFKYWSWNWQFYSRHFEALESNISALVCRVHILHNINSFLKVSEVSVFWRFSENCGTQIIVSINGTSEKTIFFKLNSHVKDKVIVLMTFKHLVHFQKQYWTIKTKNSGAGGLETKHSNHLISLPYGTRFDKHAWLELLANITTDYHEFLFLKTVSTLSTFLKFDLFCFHIVSDQLIFWRVGAIQKKTCLLLKKVRLH